MEWYQSGSRISRCGQGYRCFYREFAVRFPTGADIYIFEGECCRVVWNDNYSTPTITIFIERISCTVSWEAERGSVVRIGRCHWAFPSGVVPGPRGILAGQSGVVSSFLIWSLDVVSVECLNQGTNDERSWTWKVASFYPELSWSACSAVG